MSRQDIIHLLLPTLLYEAEDGLDGVESLLDDRRVQDVVPLAPSRLQQQLSCIASRPVPGQSFKPKKFSYHIEIKIMILMLMSHLGELLVESMSSAEVRPSITFSSNSCLTLIMVMMTIINISCSRVMVHH